MLGYILCSIHVHELAIHFVFNCKLSCFCVSYNDELRCGWLCCIVFSTSVLPHNELFVPLWWPPLDEKFSMKIIQLPFPVVRPQFTRILIIQNRVYSEANKWPLLLVKLVLTLDKVTRVDHVHPRVEHVSVIGFMGDNCTGHSRSVQQMVLSVRGGQWSVVVKRLKPRWWHGRGESDEIQ